jgi:hypothetical protein
MHRVAFSVDDIDEALAIAARHGCHPLRGVATYEDVYKPDAWLPTGTCRLLIFPVNALKPHRYPPIAPSHVRVGWCLWTWRRM